MSLDNGTAHDADHDLSKYKTVEPNRPLYGSFATPGNMVDALIYLQMADYEIEVARGALPPQVLAAKFIRARAIAQQLHASASVHAYLTHLAESIDFGLKPYGETISSKDIAAFGAR
jgi:hypothetical protein